MLRFLQALNSFLATLLALVVLGLLSAGSWYTWNTYHKNATALASAERQLDAKQQEVSQLSNQLDSRNQQLTRAQNEISQQAENIQRLNVEVDDQKKEIQRLDTAVRLLKIDHRMARITVLDQHGSAKDGTLTTTFSFAELGADGRPMEKPREFTVEGDIVYIDAWVIKFADAKIESGDPLTSTSVCLFRRVFGERQEPRQGFVLDPVGVSPTAYRPTGPASDAEREVWNRFWDYANDPGMAQKVGVRAAHGEAPYVKLVPGRSYRVDLRASGGLTIVAESADAPHSDSAAAATAPATSATNTAPAKPGPSATAVARETAETANAARETPPGSADRPFGDLPRASGAPSATSTETAP